MSRPRDKYRKYPSGVEKAKKKRKTEQIARKQFGALNRYFGDPIQTDNHTEVSNELFY
jgi:hypothetical protein